MRRLICLSGRGRRRSRRGGGVRAGRARVAQRLSKANEAQSESHSPQPRLHCSPSRERVLPFLGNFKPSPVVATIHQPRSSHVRHVQLAAATRLTPAACLSGRSASAIYSLYDSFLSRVGVRAMHYSWMISSFRGFESLISRPCPIKLSASSSNRIPANCQLPLSLQISSTRTESLLAHKPKDVL